MAGIFSGKYEDDFESTLTAENTASTDGPAEGDAVTNSSNSALDVDSTRPGDEGSCSEGAESDFDESAGSVSGGEGEEDTLTVSFHDISTLRRSLEQDLMIRESLASERNSNTADVSEKLVYIVHYYM